MHCKLPPKNALHSFSTYLYRVHGNTHKQPKHALTAEDIQHVVNFLQSYAELHAILLPGRIPGYKDSQLKLLPSSTTHKQVWSAYIDAAESSVRTVAYSTFNKVWKKYLPRLTVMKPLSDLCSICQDNSKLILRAANRPESEKSEVST